MKYSYQQFPSYCWYNSIPYINQDRSERESSAERLTDSSNNCLKIGDLAPDFSLEGVIGGERTNINLSEHRVKWAVVFFYASDFTFVWPTELAAVAAKINEFRRLNTVIFGISTDSIYSHKIFTQVSASGRKINFPLLSDRSQQVSKKYGVLNEKEGFTYRATFIVDPEGVIQAIFTNPPSVGRNIDEIIRIIEALQYSRKTNLVIPANWKSGEPGIERDWSMVGKY